LKNVGIVFEDIKNDCNMQELWDGFAQIIYFKEVI